MTQTRVFTIGHSSHSLEGFLQLLMSHGVTAVADVRSAPVSRFAPQFNKDHLARELANRDLGYAFLGRELGGRPNDPMCYVDGRVHYAFLSQTETFRSGLGRLLEGSQRERIAVMCSEKDPLDCHRTLLIARQLQAEGVLVTHILADGRLEPHSETMVRLMSTFGLLQSDFFRSPDELEEDAVLKQEQLIGYLVSSVEPAAES